MEWNCVFYIPFKAHSLSSSRAGVTPNSSPFPGRIHSVFPSRLVQCIVFYKETPQLQRGRSVRGFPAILESLKTIFVSEKQCHYLVTEFNSRFDR